MLKRSHSISVFLVATLLGFFAEQNLWAVKKQPNSRNRGARSLIGPWSQLKKVPKNQTVADPAFAPPPPPPYGDPIWIDGAAVKYQFGPYLEANPELAEKLGPLLDRLVGVQIVRGSVSTSILPVFDSSFTVSIADEDALDTWKLYQVNVPKTSRFLIYGNDGVVHVLQYPDAQYGRWQAKAKLPVVNDTIDINRLDIDFGGNQVRLQAGVLDNVLRVVAYAELNGMRLSEISIDIWESIKASLGLDDDSFFPFRNLYR